MQQYEKYKDTGVDWIGKIPKQWNILKLKFLFKDVSIKNRPDLDLLSVTQDQGVVPRSMVENRMVMPTGNLESFKVISRGDFAISLRSFEGGLEYSEYEGLISPAYTVLKSQKEINDNYFKFLFKSKAFIAELQLSIVGIREGKNISYEELKYSYTPIPPLSIQQAIATFLDDKTSKIDQTIAIKEKEIELLKERRQILIQKAVTKGLDDNVKMKDSGVDWIGEIPEHWEVRKLKYLTRCLNTKRIPLETTVRGAMMERNYPYYGATGIIDYVENYIFDEETILIAEDGANLVLRNLQLIYKPTGKYWVNNHSHILKPLKIINKDYLSYLMEICDYTIYISGAAQPKLTKDNLLNIIFLKPPKEEQNQIVSYLEKIEEKIAKAIALKEQEIEKLKEYKAVLIDNVVTGKVRVS